MSDSDILSAINILVSLARYVCESFFPNVSQKVGSTVANDLKKSKSSSSMGLNISAIWFS